MVLEQTIQRSMVIRIQTRIWLANRDHPIRTIKLWTKDHRWVMVGRQTTQGVFREGGTIARLSIRHIDKCIIA